MELRIAIVECRICCFTVHRMNITLVSLSNKRKEVKPDENTRSGANEAAPE